MEIGAAADTVTETRPCYSKGVRVFRVGAGLGFSPRQILFLKLEYATLKGYGGLGLGQG